VRQPAERLLVGVVLLPAGEVADVASTGHAFSTRPLPSRAGAAQTLYGGSWCPLERLSPRWSKVKSKQRRLLHYL
jgi:hypothetical protein